MMRKLAAIALALCLPTLACAQSNVWTGTVTGTGIGLIYGPRDGEPEFSLACVRGTREVLAIVYNVKPTTQDLVTLRFDDKVFDFPVKPQALKEGKMLQAAAKASPELLSAIRAAKAIRGAYGNTRLGPYAAPPAELAGAFATRCGPLV
jgi:hypothetical protein